MMMRKIEWDKEDERRRQECEEATHEREVLEDRCNRHMERQLNQQLNQQNQMMQMMMLFMMGGGSKA
jgi:Zn ribbon nucleic-acid-binding protein